MKNSSKRILTLIILITALATFSMLTVSASVVSESQTPTTADEIQIDTKYKTSTTNKITWNGNGGKIGSKKTVVTNIKKGAKIKKLPTTPKRSGYSFKGWYTKKTGGEIITVNTKPKKKVTYYAQWMKKANTNPNPTIVGGWIMEANYGTTNKFSYFFSFKNDGTFFYSYKEGSYTATTTGKYKVSNEKIFYSNILYNNHTMYKDTVSEYKFGKDTAGEYLLMPSFKYDESYVDISRGVKFRKF